MVKTKPEHAFVYYSIESCPEYKLLWIYREMFTYRSVPLQRLYRTPPINRFLLVLVLFGALIDRVPKSY